MTSSTSTYDCVVLGVGGVGSAALYHLAHRGLRVLGVDRFSPPHDRGSSHGDTRVIRQAYFEHPDYVPLLKRAYELWEALEAESGVKLYHETGLVEVGPPDGIVIPGIRESARQHDLEIEELDAAEIERRYPALRVSADLCGVFERRAGFLAVEDCVETHIREARRHGAELETGVESLSWEVKDGEVRIDTPGGSHVAKQLIICAGAWSGEVLGEIGIELEVRRKSLFWYGVNDPGLHLSAGFPTFFFELPTGIYYGFPALGDGLVKVAEHSGGLKVSDPLKVDREILAEEEERLVAFLTAHLPGVQGEVKKHSVCLYTMTPDEHFIVDRHPRHPEEVALVAGLSGHGFKFTGVLGETVAEMVTEPKMDRRAEFLSLKRF